MTIIIIITINISKNTQMHLQPIYLDYQNVYI